MPVPNAAAEGATDHSAIDRFALWSEVYDEQPNPLLSLEEDFLSPLLPDVRGLDVVDFGCGTGRWLQCLAPRHPRSLVGIDSSREMLARAAAKVGRDAVLLRAECESVSLSAGSADLCLASFVVSHLHDLEQFARQLAHALRPGGNAYISDVHPQTAASLGWKRAFRYGQESLSLETHERPIAEVMAVLEKHGFQVVLLLEPCFQLHQRAMLCSLKGSQLDASTLRNPAIYILQVRPGGNRRFTSRISEVPDVHIRGARVGFGPHASAKADLELSQESVLSISTRPLVLCGTNRATIDLTGYLLLPGLINSHDHLEFGLFPNLGRGEYRNAKHWADDIQQREAALIAQHRRISKRTRCWWGAIRNLLCGVTTVCHHNPPLAQFFTADFPVRVLRDYDWAHSLDFDSDLSTQVEASDTGKPFIIHAGEGTDDSSAGELAELGRRGLLNSRTVLVHALALDEYSIALVNRRHSSVVWCPLSNRFLFGRTLDRDLISRIDNVAIGSDSSLTSSGDLLDDIHFAHREAGVSPEQIYEMVYTASARIFRMRDGQGTIKPGGVADFIAVRDTGVDPAEALANLTACDIAMVVLRGRVQLARNRILEGLPSQLREGLEPLDVGGDTVWLRAPGAELLTEAVGALQAPIQIAGKRVQCVAKH